MKVTAYLIHKSQLWRPAALVIVSALWPPFEATKRPGAAGYPNAVVFELKNNLLIWQMSQGGRSKEELLLNKPIDFKRQFQLKAPPRRSPPCGRWNQLLRLN